jgi:chromosome segregation ATPase
MDQEMVAYFDARFREVTGEISSLREGLTSVREELSAFRVETSQRFEQVETSIRHTRVEIEGLRSEIHLVAEGVMAVGEQLESFRHEVEHEFKETRIAFRLPYEDVSGRLLNLERRADRQNRDVLDVIKERYGKPQV